MPKAQVDILMKLWSASMFEQGGSAPFDSYDNMLAIIDSIHSEDVIPWLEHEIDLSELVSAGSPSYMRDQYKVYFRDPHQLLLRMLRNREFDGKLDYAPYQYTDKDGKRHYRNMMGANFAWRHAVRSSYAPSRTLR
jgi:hypothetical protein